MIIGGGSNDLHTLAVAMLGMEGWGWPMKEGLGSSASCLAQIWPLQKASPSLGRAWRAVCLMLVSFSWSWGREQA